MSLFRKFSQRIVAARHRQAEAHVNAVLAGMDAETVRRAGFDRSQLKDSARAAYYL